MGERVAQKPLWRGQADTLRRRWLALLGLSVLLHLPVTPLAALFGLLSLLRDPRAAEPPPEELNAIPVSLLSEEELSELGGSKEPEEPEPAPAPAEAPVVAEPAPPPKPKRPDPPAPKKVEAVDGGAPDADHAPDAGPAETERKEQPKPEDKIAEGPADKSDPSSDPMALAGAAASVTDPNANVKLLLMNDRIRSHPLGPRMGSLVSRLPQWSSFFGPTALDPIRDIDRLYVAGPQFRVSAEVVAVLQYNVEERVMRSALDSIVNREPKGQWRDAKVPAANARADRAERTFVMSRPGMLIMVPPRLADDAIERGPKLGFPKVSSDAALVAFVNTPYRAFLGLGVPVTVPESIKSATIKVIPAADGGVVIDITAIDESPESAARNADVLTRGINLATQRNMGALGALLFGSETIQLVDPVKLQAKGSKIVGSATASARQVDRILNFAESFLEAMQNRPVPRSAQPQGPTGPPSPLPRPPSPSSKPGLPPRSGTGESPGTAPSPGATQTQRPLSPPPPL